MCSALYPQYFMKALDFTALMTECIFGCIYMVQTHQMVSSFQKHHPLAFFSMLDRRCLFHSLSMTLWNWQSDVCTHFTALSEKGAVFFTAFYVCGTFYCAKSKPTLSIFYQFSLEWFVLSMSSDYFGDSIFFFT